MDESKIKEDFLKGETANKNHSAPSSKISILDYIIFSFYSG